MTSPAHPTDHLRILPLFGVTEDLSRTHYLGTGAGFSGARLWRVESDTGPYCLRAMPEESVNIARLRGLHRLLRHVFEHGVAEVAVPVRTVGLSLLTSSSIIHQRGSVWQLEPWLPGQPVANPDRAQLSDALGALARWHQAAALFLPQGDEHRWFFQARNRPSPAIQERLTLIALWHADRCESRRRALQTICWKEFRAVGLRILELYQRHANAVASQLRLAASIPLTLQPCLRDVWHDNVLFTGDRVTGLIDAHASRSDNVAIDLARLVGSFVKDDMELRQVALQAYETVRRLSPQEKILVELFDNSGVLLSGLTWLDWVCVEKRAFERPERVIDRLEQIVSRMERLASAMI